MTPACHFAAMFPRQRLSRLKPLPQVLLQEVEVPQTGGILVTGVARDI